MTWQYIAVVPDEATKLSAESRLQTCIPANEDFLVLFIVLLCAFGVYQGMMYL